MISCGKDSIESIQPEAAQKIIGNPQDGTSALETRSGKIYKLRVTFNHIRCTSVDDGWWGSRDGEEIYGNLGVVLRGNTNSAESGYLWSRLRSQAQSIKAGEDIWVNKSYTFRIYASSLATAKLFWYGNVKERDEKVADDDDLGNPNPNPGGYIGWEGEWQTIAIASD